MASENKFDFTGLSIAERILLAESLWDSIARDSQACLALSDEQKSELDKRLAAEETGEMKFSTWDEVKQRLMAGK